MLEDLLDNTDSYGIIQLRERAKESYDKIEDIVNNICKDYPQYPCKEFFVNELSELILEKMGIIIRSQQ